METISVAARMNQLTSLLLERGSFDFENIFLEQKWSSESELRSMLVVTLMSVLELVRMGIASVRQDLGADSIVVERVATEDAAKAALADYDEAASFGTAKAKGDGEKAEGEDEEQAAGEGDGDPAEAVETSSEEMVPEGSEVVDAAIDPEEMHAEAANDLGAEIQGGGDDFSLEPTADVVPGSREVEGVADELSGLSTPDREGAVAEVERELEAVLSGQPSETAEVPSEDVTEVFSEPVAEAHDAQVIDDASVQAEAELVESERIEAEAERAVAEPTIERFGAPSEAEPAEPRNSAPAKSESGAPASETSDPPVTDPSTTQS